MAASAFAAGGAPEKTTESPPPIEDPPEGGPIPDPDDAIRIGEGDVDGGEFEE
jgi:hypothetical protein